MFNIAINRNNDYSYIAIFIDYLKQLIAIIKDLFSSVGTTPAAETTTTPAA